MSIHGHSATAPAVKPSTPGGALRAKLAALILNRYTAFLLGLFGYSLLIKQLGGLGGTSVLTEYLEVGLVLYLYWYFNRILRPSAWQPWLAAVPLLLAYVGQDIYYLMYGKVFRVIEFTEVPELLAVLSPTAIALLLLVVVLPLGLFVVSVDRRKMSTVVIGILPVLFIAGAAEFFSRAYATTFERLGHEIVFWSDGASVENNGRFAMLLYREAERKISNIKTASFRNRPAYDAQAHQFAHWVSVNGNHRNIYVVVMESLLDPTLFRGAHYTHDPIHPRFRKLFGNKLGLSVSPVFGGKTSQAEFEVLCGVPAFEELAGVEFNAFTGSPAYCLPGILKLAGYRTIATNAFRPNFFNTIPAYMGIGFGEMYFPQEYSGTAHSYFSTGDTTDEDYMFDATLFNQNLIFLAQIHKDATAPPTFNYVLTIYGHMPHLINEKKRPRVLKLVGRFGDPQLERSANQFYYRSAAIADYVNAIVSRDKNSLIILVSDHVPPLQFGPNTYRDLRYLDNRPDSIHLNRILIIENGRVKKYATIHHYDVPKIILNYITQGAYCRDKVCGFTQNRLLPDRLALHDQYMKLMAHATE